MDVSIKRLAPGDQIPARDYNAMAAMCEAMARATGHNLFVDETGLHFRSKASPRVAGDLIAVVSGPSARNSGDPTWATYTVQRLNVADFSAMGGTFACIVMDNGIAIGAGVCIGTLQLASNGAWFCVPHFGYWSAQFQLNLWDQGSPQSVGNTLDFFVDQASSSGGHFIGVPCDCTLWEVAVHVTTNNANPANFVFEVLPIGKMASSSPVVCPTEEVVPCVTFYRGGSSVTGVATVVGFRARIAAMEDETISYSPATNNPSCTLNATFLRHLN